VVKLANGMCQPLSSSQVGELRKANHSVLPTKIRIPVPTDVAATIEPRFLIED